MMIKLNSAFRYFLFLTASSFALLAAVVRPASAAGPLIQVQAEVDSSVITLGDRITYSMTIRHDPSLKIQQPGPGANLGQFEIKDYNIDEPYTEKGMQVQKFEYKISVFDTGRFVIPPFPVAFSESDTSGFQIIQSEPIEIFVKSVLTGEDAELKDIKPPVNIPVNYKRYIWISLLTLLILAAIFFLIFYLRRRKTGQPLFGKKEIRPAHEVALESLAALQSRWREMMDQQQYKQLYTEISAILRQYLENRFFIPALEETSGEIDESMAELGLSPAPREKARAVL
ncbi:MAG: DUF4381 family protein, partial [Calditrichia bacterium]